MTQTAATVTAVETYQSVSALTGRPIRKATKVTLPDGQVIRFLERMSKREAIRQALRERERGL